MAENADAELRDVIARFTTAEQSLRILLDAAKGMNAAKEDLVGARKDLEVAREAGAQALKEGQRRIEASLLEADATSASRLDATVNALNERLAAAQDSVMLIATTASKSLETSQSALMDAGAGVHGLTRQLTDIVRDLNYCALALRSLQPDLFHETLAELSRGQKRTRRLIWAWGLLIGAMCLGLLANAIAPFGATVFR